MLGLEINESQNVTSSKVPVMPTGISSDANPAGAYAASFASGMSSDTQEKLCAMLSNGNPLASVELVVGDGGAVFVSTEESEAVAYITRDSTTTEYSSLAEATAAAVDGDTVYVNVDLSVDEIAESSSETSASLAFTVDLNGYDVAMITCESSQNVTVIDSSENATSSVTGYEDSLLYGIVQEGSGTLTLDGITVDAQNVSGSVNYGVYVESGTVKLQNCTINVDATSGSVHAVGLMGGNVVASGTKIYAEAANASSLRSVAVYVADSSSSAELDGCTLSATGVSELVAGAYIRYGSLSASTGSEDEEMSLAAEAAGSTNSAYGVYAFSVTSVSLSGCALDATTEEDSTGASWCVYAPGSSSSSGTYGADIALGGEMSFESTSGYFVYHAVEALQIASDFSVPDDDVVTLQSVSLAGDHVFATPAEEGGSLSSMKSLFAAAAASDNTYLGWQVSVNDDGSLSWSKKCVATTGGEEYVTLSEAL